MNEDNKEKKVLGISRRQFLGTGAAVAGGAIVGDQLFPRELRAVGIPKAWDRETEVVVVGTGYAGLAAAVEASDANSKVIILEKNPFIGGNSIIASGVYNAADPERQKKQGIEDSTDLHYKHTIGGGDFKGDPEKVRYLVENALGGLKWLEKMGVELEPKVYAGIGALHPRSHDPIRGGRGAAIIKALKNQADKRNIPILLGHKLTGIVREKPLEGMILGVEVENKGEKLYFKGKKAIVLATGGFSADVNMRSKYDPKLTADIPTTNIPTTTGEAIIYAEDEGADVVGMDYIQMLMGCNYYTKKYGSLANVGIESAIFINTKGVRFVAEDQRRDVMGEALMQQPKKLLLWVADEQCKKRYNPELTEKYVKEGLIFKADTIEGLGKILQEKFDVPLNIFMETVRKYNESAKRGEDKEFGKKVENLKLIEQPPFWASPTQSGVHHTMGGLRTKGETAQVIDRHNRLIPRLYAAGEVTGGIHGTNRLGGNATVDCIVFGRLAGKNAAAEKSWG